MSVETVNGIVVGLVAGIAFACMMFDLGWWTRREKRG